MRKSMKTPEKQEDRNKDKTRTNQSTKTSTNWEIPTILLENEGGNNSCNIDDDLCQMLVSQLNDNCVTLEKDVLGV